MSQKKEYLILFLIIAGAVLYLYFNRADQIHYRLPEPAPVDRSDIAGIRIERPGFDPLVLEKKEGDWRIRPDGYAADTNAVEGMLSAVTDLTLTTLVSESENYRRYDLDPDQALVVSALADDGSVLRRFMVGKNAPVQEHTFVMTADDPRVYQARGRLRRAFDKTVDALRDKTVLAFVVEDIQKIDISVGEKAVTLVKQAGGEATAGAVDDMVWVCASSRSPADQAVVKELLTSLSSLECRSFITEIDRKMLPEPVYTVALTEDPSKETSPVYALSLFFGEDPDSADYRGISSRQDDVFVLPSYTAERIMKRPDELIAEKETG